MKIATALRLGRVSNLPTVWTNSLVGVLLSRASFSVASYALIAFSMTLFYVGGMYLNDAFDRDFDARTRAGRPIPSGQVSARTVFVIGFGLLAAGLAGVMSAALGGGNVLRAGVGGVALGALIVFYNVHHKHNPLSPVLMGLCRVLVYLTSALCLVSVPPAALLIAAGVLFVYLVGLTYTAKQEDMGRHVGPYIRYLIAGISLIDGATVTLAGRPELGVVCVAAFALTLLGQRFVPGT